MPRKDAKLFSQTDNGKVHFGMEVSWQGIDMARRQSETYESILSLAQLPSLAELREIHRVSIESSLPCIFRRAVASPLELNAASLITALTFANRKQWSKIVGKFLVGMSLRIALPGRPIVEHASPSSTDVQRGKEIEAIAGNLLAGYAVKREFINHYGKQSSVDALKRTLKSHGFRPEEIEQIVIKRSSQDAACHIYWQTRKKENVTLKATRNSYARYKKLKTVGIPHS